jgi:phage terminase small subunit
MKTNEQLTPQQQRFCEEYLVSFNAYKSAIAAGYSQSTARKAEMLHLPQVQAFLKAGMQKTSERLQVTHDMVLRELYKIAFANMGDYYDENAVLRPINQLSDDQKAAISQYQLIDCIGDYQERAGELSKIKLHNKLSALDKIARHIGFYRSMEDGRGKMEDVYGGMEDVRVRMGDYVSREPEVLSREVSLESEGLSQEPEGLEVGVECVAVSEAVTGRAENTPVALLKRGNVEKSLTIAPFGTGAKSREQGEKTGNNLTIAPFIINAQRVPVPLVASIRAGLCVAFLTGESFYNNRCTGAVRPGHCGLQ